MIRINTISLNSKDYFSFLLFVVAVCFTGRWKNTQPRLQTKPYKHFAVVILSISNDLSIHSSQPRPSAMLLLPPPKHPILHDISRFTSLWQLLWFPQKELVSQLRLHTPTAFSSCLALISDLYMESLSFLPLETPSFWISSTQISPCTKHSISYTE